ncbi:MAG: SPOR domain-containing protein [Pseudomonadota bacterium]
MDPRGWILERHAWLALLAAGALMACEPMTTGSVSTSDDAPDVAPTLAVSEADVERPELFAVAATGRWDGRPSLGGIWVAHPESTQPERVIIRRVDTEESVKGALFRRDRVVTGAPFQISSDAAEALGIAVGEDVVIEVIAIRREVQAASVPEPEGEATAPAIDATEAAPTTAEDVIDVDAIVAATGTGAATVAADGGPPIVSPLPRPGGTPTPEGTETETAAVAPPIPVEETAPETAPAEPAPAEEAPVDATVSAAPTTPVAEPEEPRVGRYVQVGTFGIRENARDLVEVLRRDGFDAEARDVIVGDREFSRVIIGPVGDPAELSRTLGALRARGFTDAIVVGS